MASATILSLAFALTATADAAGDGWRYVLPPPGEAFEHPPLRALVLSPARPDDVVEKAAYRGRRRRYAQLRYGGPNSVRITVVLDEAGPGDADLYVDAGRNRRIEPGDKVEPAADRRTWRLPLRPAFEANGSGTAGEAPVPRSLVFRLGATGTTLAFAAAGYLEGNLALRGHAHAARRVDGDGNGLLTDPQDRLWIDLDDDGRWDAAGEQFLYAPVLAIGGTRYATRSDVMGRRLSLDELEGTGTVRLALAPGRSPVSRSGTAEGVELSALLVGRDGSAVSLSGAREEVVPVGEYRLAAVSVIVSKGAGAGGARWSFLFADGLRRGAPVWHAVVKDGRHIIDPVGALDLRTGLDLGPESRARPGEPLELQPQLYTGDGLLIVTAHRGTAVPGVADHTATVELRGADGGLLGQARSGFL
jgi:hypothetical protein